MRLTIRLFAVAVCREHSRKHGVAVCRTCPLAWCDERDVEVDVWIDADDIIAADYADVIATHDGDPWARRRYALDEREQQSAAEQAREQWGREHPAARDDGGGWLSRERDVHIVDFLGGE